MNLLESLIYKIEYHKKNFSPFCLQSKDFQEKQQEYYISRDEKIFKELLLLAIYEGDLLKYILIVCNVF